MTSKGRGASATLHYIGYSNEKRAGPMSHLFTETSNPGRGQGLLVFYKYINPVGEGSSPRSHHLPKTSLESTKGVGAETSGRRKRLNLRKVGSAADRPGLLCASGERLVWQGLDDQLEQRILELRKSLKSRVMGGLDFLLANFASTALQGHTGTSYKVGLFHSSFPV